MCNELFKDELLSDLEKLLKEKKGLTPFSKNRKKFENWLQVELCEILVKKGKEVTPEFSVNGGNVDIVFENREGRHRCAIELKVIPSRIKCAGVIDPKGDTVAYGQDSVLKDIKKLRFLSEEFETRMIIFFVFPIPLDTKQESSDDIWITKISSVSLANFNIIKEEVKQYGGGPLLKKVVNFNNIKGIIFLGTIRTAVT